MPCRAATTWIGMRPRSRWSARSSIALIAYSPLAEILIAAVLLAESAALENLRGLPREVRDDDVGAGTADRGERLHHGALLVEPAEPPGGPDHRVLAGDGVRGERHAELHARASDDVEVRQRRLHHDDVRPLVQIESDLAHRLLAIRGVHLISAAVAELRRAVRRFAERAVVRGRV